MKEIDLQVAIEQMHEQLVRGVFLSAGDGKRENTMTIAWANSGRMWDRRCMQVAVRFSRYTHQLMEEGDEFLISIPETGSMKEELAYCGTYSGRDGDKFESCNLNKVYLDDSYLPFIEECSSHILCRKVYQQTMEPSLIQAEYVEKKYSGHDYHTMYYGEIIKAYRS